MLLLPFLAQAQIQTTLNVNPPYSTLVSDYITNFNRAITLQLVNTGNVPLDVRLSGTLRGSSGVTLFVPDDLATFRKSGGQAITVAAKQVKPVRYADIQNAFGSDPSINNSSANLRPAVISSLILPEGDYELCVKVFDANSNKALAEPVCTFFSISNIEPPYLLAPVDKDVVTTAQATYQPIQFQWTYPAGASPTKIEYVLQVAELRDGQNEYNVFQSGPPFAEIVIPTSNPIYIFKPADPRFEVGRTYAWRVQVRGKGTNAGLVNFQNNGYSTVNTFTYGGVTYGKVVSKSDAPTETSKTEPKKDPAKPVVNLSGGTCACKFPDVADKVAATDWTNDKTIYIGSVADGYQLSISEISGAGGKFTGNGTVALSPTFGPTNRSGIFLPLRVEFKDIQVNKAGVLLSGEIQSMKRAGNLMGLMPSAAAKPGMPATPGLPDADELAKIVTGGGWKAITDKITEEAGSLFSQAQQQANQQRNGAGFETPIGYSAGPFTLAVDNIVFSATTAQYDAMTVIDAIGGSDPLRIPLGVRGACMPSASCQGNTLLYLLKDTSIPYLGLTLRGGLDAANSTYYTYSPNAQTGGTSELSIAADYYLKDAQYVTGSDTVKADIRAKTVKGFDNWNATATIANEFKIKGIDDFTFKLNTATFDHDLESNPAGFPAMLASLEADLAGKSVATDKLANLRSNTWRGFFMDKLTVFLPTVFKSTKTARTFVEATNLVIDGRLGLSGSLGAGNADKPVIDYKTGNLDGWFFSLDNIGITFFDGRFVKANATGKIGLPITGDNPSAGLTYTNTLSTDASTNKLTYLFKVVPDKDIDVPIWKANMKLASTSSISVVVTGSSIDAVADLNGGLSFKADLGGPIPDFNLDLMEMEHLKIMSKAPYISVDKLTSPVYDKAGKLYQQASDFAGKFASPQHSLGSSPMPISLDAFTPVMREGKAGFYFHGTLDLADMPLSPKAGVGLLVLANVKMNGIRPSFSYDRTELEDVSVKGQLGPVLVDGSLHFFREGKPMGNGFKGHLEATFGGTKIIGQAIFGRQDFGYWYFYLAGINPAGLFQVGPITVNGLGGGLYHNMTPPKPDANQFAALKEGNYDYTPQQGSDGLKASIYFSVASQFVLNAKATLEGSMTDGALDIISLTGNGKLIGDESGNSMLTAAVNATYHFPQKIFTLDAAINGGKPGLLTVEGQLALKADFDQGKFYLKIGEPTKRNTIRLAGDFAEATGYFMVGNSEIPGIPEPDPGIISQESMAGFKKAGYKGFGVPAAGMPASFSTDASDTPGMAFGATLKVGKKISFAIFWADFHGGAGADVSLRKLKAVCEERPGQLIGLNGWYANGQAYAEFCGGVGVNAPFVGDVKIVELKAAALLQAGLPSPSWFQGFVHGEAHLLGIFNGSFDLPVSIGDPCTPVSNPYANKPLFASFNIDAGNKDKVDILLNPQVQLNYPAKFSVDGIRNDGNAFHHDYEIRVKTTLSPTIAGEPYYNDDKVMYRKASSFKPKTDYTVGYNAVAWEDNKPYLFMGKAIKQDTLLRFRSGPCISVIDDQSLAYVFPYKEQAYYLPGESKQGTVRLIQEIGCLFDPAQVTTEIVITPDREAPTEPTKTAVQPAVTNKPGSSRITIASGLPVSGRPAKPTPIHVPITSNGANVFYTMPRLAPGARVRLEVVQRPVVPPSLLDFAKKSTTTKGIYDNNYVASSSMKLTDNDINKQLGKQNSAQSVLYDLSVKRDTVSKKLVVAQPPGKVILSYQFTASQYNTLAEKLNANGSSGSANASLQSDHWLVARFASAEGFDGYDADDFAYNDNGKAAVNPALVNVAEETSRWMKETIAPLNRQWYNLEDQLRKTPDYRNQYNPLELATSNEGISIVAGDILTVVSNRIMAVIDYRLPLAKWWANWAKANAAGYHKWVDDTYGSSDNHYWTGTVKHTYNTIRGYGEGTDNPKYMMYRFLIAAEPNISPLSDYNPYPFGDFNYLKTNINTLIGFDGMTSLRAKLPLTTTVHFGYTDPMHMGKTGNVRKTYTLKQAN